jgi:CheY-like chemotaxis protein
MVATILIADDEEFIVDLLATLLEDEGYRVLRAFNGVEALRHLEQERPALLLTDNMMPRMSGMELVHHLHANPHLAVPVIMMSAVQLVPSPPPPIIFVRKPFDLDRLLATIETQIASA